LKIWVDADALPRAIRDILFRAAERTGIELTLVANQWLETPPLANIRSLQVMQGADVADLEIVRRSVKGDLVITADIPEAAELIAKDVMVLSPRGEEFTRENVRARLNMRDFMDTMRGSGIPTGGPPPLSAKDRQTFANALDRLIARHHRPDSPPVGGPRQPPRA
tara:strand:- start:594 stop:1088 length:495 start_codon:yes stop_codon:yes gene_type:complete